MTSHQSYHQWKGIVFLSGGLASTTADAHAPPGALEVMLFGFGSIIALALFILVFLVTWRPSVTINKPLLFAEFCMVAFLTACALMYLPKTLQTDYPFLLPLVAVPAPLGAFIFRCRQLIRKGAADA